MTKLRRQPPAELRINRHVLRSDNLNIVLSPRIDPDDVGTLTSMLIDVEIPNTELEYFLAAILKLGDRQELEAKCNALEAENKKLREKIDSYKEAAINGSVLHARDLKELKQARRDIAELQKKLGGR